MDDFAKFNKPLEAMRAIGQNAWQTFLHPVDQQKLAMEIARQYAAQWLQGSSMASPLNPDNRPGVPQEALPASRKGLLG